MTQKTHATSRPQSSQSGMTVLEVLIVVAIIGALTNLAIPSIKNSLLRGRAVAVIGDFSHVRDTLYRHYRDANEFPAETPLGVVPGDLRPYLGAVQSWSGLRAGAAYDWDNWVDDNGVATHPETGIRYGFSMVTTESDLLDMIERLYDGKIFRLWDDRLTFVIEPTLSTASDGSSDSGDEGGSGDGDSGGSGDDGSEDDGGWGPIGCR